MGGAQHARACVCGCGWRRRVGQAPDCRANLVVVEGGLKAISRMTKLMLHRIKWAEHVGDAATSTAGDGVSHGRAADDDEEDDDVDGGGNAGHSSGGGGGGGGALDMYGPQGGSASAAYAASARAAAAGNYCELLWQGVVSKRAFNAFRIQVRSRCRSMRCRGRALLLAGARRARSSLAWVPHDMSRHLGPSSPTSSVCPPPLACARLCCRRAQECRTSATARKVMEARGVAHYWDMCLDETRSITKSSS